MLAAGLGQSFLLRVLVCNASFWVVPQPLALRTSPGSLSPARCVFHVCICHWTVQHAETSPARDVLNTLVIVSVIQTNSSESLLRIRSIVPIGQTTQRHFSVQDPETSFRTRKGYSNFTTCSLNRGGNITFSVPKCMFWVVI